MSVRRYMYPSKAVLIVTVMAAMAGFGVAMALASAPGGMPEGWVAPIRSANPGPSAPQAVTEDSPGWDCLRQGNVTCRIDGVLVTSLEGLPTDPFARCVFLLDVGRRVDPDGLTYADTVCDPIRQQRG